jgi:hypothetical protein
VQGAGSPLVYIYLVDIRKKKKKRHNQQINCRRTLELCRISDCFLYERPGQKWGAVKAKVGATGQIITPKIPTTKNGLIISGRASQPQATEAQSSHLIDNARGVGKRAQPKKKILSVGCLKIILTQRLALYSAAHH